MRFLLITTALFLLILGACQDELDRRLDDIEKIALNNPDSAFVELGKGFDSTKMSRRQAARHKLITAVAMEVSYMDSILLANSDSLLSLPLELFRDVDDGRRLAIALYLKGRCDYSNTRYPDALRYLIESSYYADNDTMPYWSMRIHELISQTYKNAYQGDKAIEHLRKAKEYCRLIDNKIMELCIWGSISFTYDEENQHDMAVATADSILREYDWLKKDNPTWWQNINFFLLPVYADAKENDKALKAFSYIRNKPNPLGYAYFLGVCRMHANIGDNNTANIYLDSAFMISRTHRDTMVCKGYLAERYRREGRDEEAIRLEYLVKKWSDSIASATLNQSLAQVEADFNREKWLCQQEKNRRLKLIGWSAAAVILLGGCAAMILIRHRQRKNQDRLIALESELRNTFDALQIREEELKTLKKYKDEVDSKKRIDKVLDDKIKFINHVAEYWIGYGGNDYNGKGIDLRNIVAALRDTASMKIFHDIADKEKGKWPNLNEKEGLLKTMLDLGLTIKGASMLLNESQKTVYTRRNRLKAKLSTEGGKETVDEN